MQAFYCALLEDVAGEEEGDCECYDCVGCWLVGERIVFGIVVVVWGRDAYIPMVEEMATETWLWVRSILRNTCTDTGQMYLIRVQGRIMYIDTAEVP